MAGVFITFEGIDGCGKSTQLRLLAGELRVRGIDVVTTREPGGTTLGLKLRAALLDVQEQVDPLAELLVFAADRAEHVRTLLRPALAAGKVVMSDRYADATVAYQGAGRGFAPELINEIVQLATEGLKPDLTLLFDLTVPESAVRTRHNRGVPCGLTFANTRRMRRPCTGVAGNASMWSRVSCLRHDDGRPAILTGRKLVRPRVICAAYSGHVRVTKPCAWSLNLDSMARSVSSTPPVADVPPTLPVAGSKLTCLLC